MNAVSNAVKFTPIGGGGVIMSARLLRDSSPSSVEIQVTDSGRGLLGKTLHELATEVSGSIPLRPTAFEHAIVRGRAGHAVEAVP